MQNRFFLSILIILSIFFSTKIWEFIKLDGRDIQILGEYYNNGHHALNDPLRYIVFIFIPLLTFTLYKIFCNKSSVSFLNLKFDYNLEEKKINYLFYIYSVSIFFFILEFLSITFPLNLLDIFHEGQKLSAPFKSLLDNKLWSGSFVTTGIIDESLGVKLFWNYIGNSSIGSMRFVQLLYIFFLKLSLVMLIYQISKNVILAPEFKILFYIILIFISQYLIDYNFETGDNITYRDLPIVLCLVFFIKNLINKNINLTLILISFFAVTSFFWSIDRALVLNLFIIFIFIIFFLNDRIKEIYLIFISIIIFWFIFYIIMGEEFYYFMENTFSVFKDQNYIHGIIHPKPFSDMENSSRATKSLLLITFSCIISLNYLFSKKKNNNNLKIIVCSITLIAFLSYLYALSRSDGGHIKQTTGFLILTFSIVILFNVLKFFNNKVRKKLSKNLLFFLIILPSTTLLILNFKINFENILNYHKRLNEYILLEDKNFLSDKQNYLISELKPMLKNQNCIQLFTYDAALPYLLKKKNCSKYYFIYSMGSIKHQKEYIENLNEINVIIYRGQTDNWGLIPQEKLYLVDEFINSRYSESIKIYDWEIKFK